MAAYIVFFLFLTLPLFKKYKLDYTSRSILFFFFFVLLAFFVGLRYKVGGDWLVYEEIYLDISSRTLEEVSQMFIEDVGYNLLNWISAQLHGGILLVNLICASFFSYGLIRFANVHGQANLVLLVAFPYMIMVVALGYTRQSVALGFFLLALSYLMQGKRLVFFFWLIPAILFHRTAAVLLIFGFLNFSKRRTGFFQILIIIVIISFGASLIAVRLPFYINSYTNPIFSGEIYHSHGTFYRLILNLVPGLILISYKEQWNLHFHDYKVWKLFFMISLAVTPIAFFYSTITDRIIIYCMPLQLSVFSRLPLLVEEKTIKSLWLGITVVLQWVLFLGWLILAVNSSWWLPYQNYLTKDIFNEEPSTKSRKYLFQ